MMHSQGAGSAKTNKTKPTQAVSDAAAVKGLRIEPERGNGDESDEMRRERRGRHAAPSCATSDRKAKRGDDVQRGDATLNRICDERVRRWSWDDDE